MLKFSYHGFVRGLGLARAFGSYGVYGLAFGVVMGMVWGLYGFWYSSIGIRARVHKVATFRVSLRLINRRSFIVCWKAGKKEAERGN